MAGHHPICQSDVTALRNHDDGTCKAKDHANDVVNFQLSPGRKAAKTTISKGHR